MMVGLEELDRGILDWRSEWEDIYGIKRWYVLIKNK